jgi:hypothetical protein
LRDSEKLKDAIEYSEGLLEREEDRSNKIESKAFALIGITGIASGFITGFAGLLLDRAKITSTCIIIFAAVLYFLVVISLMWTIYLATRVVKVGDYWFTYPSANDILRLSDASLQYVKRERAAALFFSFAQNHRVVNRKATFLSGAQLWFRNSIALLLALTLLLTLYTLFKSPNPASTTSAPTVPAFAPTAIAPTHTSVTTPTVTIQPSPITTPTVMP